MFEFQWNQRPSEPPGTPSRSAGTRPFRSSLLWMACSWSFALPLDGHWLYPFGGHNLLGAIVYFFPIFAYILFNCQVFAPVCFLDCMDLMFVYAQHVFLVYACKVLFVMVHVCLMLWSLLFFLFFPSRMQKREWFAMDSPTWMTILREDSSGNIDNLVGLPSGYLT